MAKANLKQWQSRNQELWEIRSPPRHQRVKDQGLRYHDLLWWEGVHEEMANQYSGRRTQVNYTIRSVRSGLIGYIIWWPRNCSCLQYWQIDTCAAPGHHFSCHGNSAAVVTLVRRRKWTETQSSLAHWFHPRLGREIRRLCSWTACIWDLKSCSFTPAAPSERDKRPNRCKLGRIGSHGAVWQCFY